VILAYLVISVLIIGVVKVENIFKKIMQSLNMPPTDDSSFRLNFNLKLETFLALKIAAKIAAKALKPVLH
jgi:uncharacterized membrane protein